MVFFWGTLGFDLGFLGHFCGIWEKTHVFFEVKPRTFFSIKNIFRTQQCSCCFQAKESKSFSLWQGHTLIIFLKSFWSLWNFAKWVWFKYLTLHASKMFRLKQIDGKYVRICFIWKNPLDFCLIFLSWVLFVSAMFNLIIFRFYSPLVGTLTQSRRGVTGGSRVPHPLCF